METRTKYALAIAAIALAVFAARLIITYQVAEPSYASYPALIQAQSIRATGLPLYHDPYSYEGRTHAFPPLYYYFVAFFMLFLPATLVVKALPAACMAALVPLIYLLCKRLTKHRGASLAAAFFAGFAPALYSGAADATPLSLVLPVLAGLLLAIFKLDRRPLLALILTAMLTLLSPLVWLVLVAYLAYLAILAAERLAPSPRFLELSLVTFLLALWYTLVTYKEALVRHGFSVLVQSLPASVRAATYADFTLLAMVFAVGVVPLALGSLAIYHAAFEERSRGVLLLASLGLVTLVAASLQMLPLPVALLMLAFVFTVLAAPGLGAILYYLRKTRFERISVPLIVALLLFFLLTSLFPAIVAGLYPGTAPKAAEIDAAHWLREETPKSSVVLAAPKTGAMLNYEAQRRYVADEDYLLIANPDAILADIDRAYTTSSTVATVELLERYGVKYVFIGPREHTRYAQFGAIIDDPSCFPIAYRNSLVEILAVNCTTEGSR